MKNKYSGLSTEEQIKRYKKENKTLLVCAIICSIVVVTISILFFVYDLDRTLAIGLLIVLPFSWWILGDSKGGKLIIYYLEKDVEKNIEISFSKKLIKELIIKNIYIK